MIKLQNLAVGYAGCTVLQNVSLSFAEGEVTVLLGPNGCGKSTLLKSVLGLIPTQAGEVLLDGERLDQLTAREIALKVAYMAQSRNVPSITARRMVLHGRFPHLAYPRRYRIEDYAMADRALDWANARELSENFMDRLSGGQRQKVYLAMALAQDTPNILMDEPTSYLDVQHQLEVMSMARRLAGMGRCVVMVLHDLSLALRTADRVALLHQGELLRMGTPEEVYLSGDLNRAFSVEVRRVETDEGWQYYCARRAEKGA